MWQVVHKILQLLTAVGVRPLRTKAPHLPEALHLVHLRSQWHSLQLCPRPLPSIPSALRLLPNWLVAAGMPRPQQ